MADAIDLSGLTGLLSQFQPSDADRATAQKQEQMQFFLGLLGARKGMELQQIGRSGLLAMQGYQDSLKQQQALQLQNMQAALPLLQLSMAQRASQNMRDMLSGANQTVPGPSTPLAPGSVGGSGMGDGTDALFGQGSQPGPVAGPPTQVPANPNLRQQLTDYNLAQLPITKTDYSAAIKARFPDPISGRPGGWLKNPLTGQLEYLPKIPEGSTVQQNPDGSMTVVPIPGAFASEAARTAALTGATEGAKSNFDTMEVPVGNGQTRTMTRADFLRTQQPPTPPPFVQQPFAPPTNPPVALSGRPTASVGMPANGTSYSPAQMAQLNAARDALRADEATGKYGPGGTGQPAPGQPPASPSSPPPSTGQFGPQPGNMGGFGVTASPLAIEQGKANIDVAAKQTEGFNATNQATASKQLEELQNARPAAYRVLSALDQLERSDNGQVFNGPAQQVYGESVNWINSMLGTNIDASKITNSQTYNAALQTAVRGALKQFPGGRIFQSEFASTLQGMPSLIATPQGRQQIRAMLGAASLDIINQTKSAEQYFNPQSGLTGWSPPSPITPSQYWPTRANLLAVQPRPDLDPEHAAAVRTILKSGNPDAIKQVLINGLAR